MIALCRTPTFACDTPTADASCLNVAHPFLIKHAPTLATSSPWYSLRICTQRSVFDMVVGTCWQSTQNGSLCLQSYYPWKTLNQEKVIKLKSTPKFSLSKPKRWAWSPYGWVTVMCWALCPPWDIPIVKTLFWLCNCPLDETLTLVCMHVKRSHTRKADCPTRVRLSFSLQSVESGHYDRIMRKKRSMHTHTHTHTHTPVSYTHLTLPTRSTV